MIYKIKVHDTAGVAIPGARLTWYNADGSVHGSITSSNGAFSVDDSQQSDLWDDSISMTVSAPGFADDAGWHMTDFDPTVVNLITLLKSNKTLLYVAGGAAGALLLASFVEKQKKVGAFWDGISPKVKLALGIGGAFALYYMLSKDNSNKKLPANARAELDQLAAQGIKPTITVTQADAFSNVLVQAFGGCGTDESNVYLVFSALQNQADLVLLIYVYDIRSYQGCFEGMIWEENVSANLAQALANELSSSEIAHVNSILADKGINFSF